MKGSWYQYDGYHGEGKGFSPKGFSEKGNQYGGHHGFHGEGKGHQHGGKGFPQKGFSEGKGNQCGGKGFTGFKVSDYYSSLPFTLAEILRKNRSFCPMQLLTVLRHLHFYKKELALELTNRIAELHSMVHLAGSISKIEQRKELNGIYIRVLDELSQQAKDDLAGDRWNGVCPEADDTVADDAVADDAEN
jgi:hypothetical protein